MVILDNFIYIYHLDKFCVLPTMPDTITDSMNSTFQSTNALSRSAPVWSYSNSGPRSISFNLDLHRDIMEDINEGVSNLKDNVIDFTDADYIDILLNYLQACSLPKYNVYKAGSKVVEPPQVAVKMGKDIFIRGIVNGGVSVAYKKPILDNDRYASAVVTFTVTEVDPYDAPTVAMSGGFRGVTATFKNGIYKDNSDTSSYAYQEYTTPSVTTGTTTIRSNRWDYSGPDSRKAPEPPKLPQRDSNGSKELFKDPNKDLLQYDLKTTEDLEKFAEDYTKKHPNTKDYYDNFVKINELFNTPHNETYILDQGTTDRAEFIDNPQDVLCWIERDNGEHEVTTVKDALSRGERIVSYMVDLSGKNEIKNEDKNEIGNDTSPLNNSQQYIDMTLDY